MMSGTVRRRSAPAEQDLRWALFFLVAGVCLFISVGITVSKSESKTEVRRKEEPEAKVLITGVQGFIGLHFALLCKEKKMKVHGIDFGPSSGGIGSKRWSLLQENGIKLHSGSVLDRKFLDSVFQRVQPRWVVDFTQHERYVDKEVNIQLMSNLLAACTSAMSVKRFFYTSPNQFYIPSSRSGEEVVNSLASTLKFSVTEWRLSTVFGRFGRPDMQYYRFLKGILCNTSFAIGKDTMGMQNYMHISDAVRSMFESAAAPVGEMRGKVRVVDIGTGLDPVSQFQIVRLLENLTGKAAKVTLIPYYGDSPLEVEYVKASHLWPVSGKITSLEDDFVQWYTSFDLK